MAESGANQVALVEARQDHHLIAAHRDIARGAIEGDAVEREAGHTGYADISPFLGKALALLAERRR